MSGKEWGRRLRAALEKFKYVLLVGLVGAVLLLLPTGEETARTAQAGGAETDLFQVETIERRLEDALSQVEGAGTVTVVLTLKDGPRQVLAQDGSASEGDSQTTRETSTVMASKGSGTQEPVALQELGPSYRGALVVAQGAGDPQVRLALSEAVSALTGLGADKISICKGK